MRRYDRFRQYSAFLLLLLTSSRALPSEIQAPSSSASGEELVQLLIDEQTRGKAYHQLCLRNNKNTPTDYDAFIDEHRDPEVVICPQGPDKKPIYVLLCDFLGHHDDEDWEDNNPARTKSLFPNTKRLQKRYNLMIEVFTANGKLINPLRFNDNVLSEGLLMDLNGDGLVERVDTLACGISGGGHGDVLKIDVMLEKEKPLLAVLYNWTHDNSWGYDFVDRDGDGLIEIEFGPRIDENIQPKTIYAWDKEKQTYVATKGANNVRRLIPYCIFPELERIKHHKTITYILATATLSLFILILITGKLWYCKYKKGAKGKMPIRFYALVTLTAFVAVATVCHALEGGFPSRMPLGGSARTMPSVPKANPYRYSSLKDLTDEDIVAYMGDGKSIRDLQRANVIQSQIAKDFWTLPAKSAALETANANRTIKHKNRFHIAIDDTDNATPPASCSILYSSCSDRSYNAVDAFYFLRVDPKISYFLYARTWGHGMVFYNFVYDQPAYDFRYFEMKYEEAKHMADVIWWLRRVRTKNMHQDNGSFGMHTTADGDGALQFLPDNRATSFTIKEATWPGVISERWREDYTKATYLNLSAYLLTRALPDHIGTHWSQQEPTHSHDVLARQTNESKYETTEMTHLKELTRRFLEMYSDDQHKISFPIVLEAVRATGNLHFNDLGSTLEMLDKRLPSPNKDAHTITMLSRKIEDLREQNKEGLIHWDVIRPYYEERDHLRLGLNTPGAPADIKEAIALSLKQLRQADDPKALETWAKSNNAGCQWALQRLKTFDSPRYISALEWWLKNTKPRFKRQVYAEIAHVDPKRAVELAEALPASDKNALTVSAFSVLERAKIIENIDKRTEALIRLLLNPKEEWDQRGEAIECLVPTDNPLKYPDEKIDKALLEVLDPRMADKTINFTLGRACRALALRGRVEHFSKISQRTRSVKDEWVCADMLGALVYMTQESKGKTRDELCSVLKPHLSKTNLMITEILWAIWAADLRELKPDLERLATSGPDDIEGPKASSSGGEITPVTMPYHMARKIAALWNEEDLLTRLKLLIAFSLHEAFYFSDDVSEIERKKHLLHELDSLKNQLSASNKEKIGAYLAWYDITYNITEKEPVYRERRRVVIKMIRNALGIVIPPEMTPGS